MSSWRPNQFKSNGKLGLIHMFICFNHSIEYCYYREFVFDRAFGLLLNSTSKSRNDSILVTFSDVEETNEIWKKKSEITLKVS